ncbi:hypothetical protein Poly21_01340 [Allorhodopirellula heiligendammensis]|uniref:Uncharacterized protein n=1 Tax=Allorhodopirellula heiligendammensis TaxID=2714739 RepID=A0A5C6C2U6_9BACT|nr:hypothetical protein Poly21_01340 [Allorhodopirellula heiligendammensis]
MNMSSFELAQCFRCNTWHKQRNCPACRSSKVPRQRVVPTIDLQTLTEWQADRIQICAACPHREGNRCGIITSRGRPGLLLHRLGIPNPAATCPREAPKWSATIEA